MQVVTHRISGNTLNLDPVTRSKMGQLATTLL